MVSRSLSSAIGRTLDGTTRPQVAPTLNCNHAHATFKDTPWESRCARPPKPTELLRLLQLRCPGEGLGLAVARHIHDPVETQNERELALDKLIADGLLELMNE